MQFSAITRKSALAAILLLIVILIAAALRSRLAPFGVELADSEYRGTLFGAIVAMLLIFFGGFVEGKMLPRSGLTKGYCTLPIPLYGLLSCGIFLSPDILSTAAASLCFAVAINLLLRSLHSAGEKDSVFFAALLLGTMVLLYPPAVVLVGVLPLAIFTLALSLQQVVLMVVGYLLPLFTASYVLWYGGSSMWQFGRNLIDALATPQMGAISQVPYVAIAMLLAVVAVLVWGLIYSHLRQNKMFQLVRVRRSLHLFIWVLILALTMLFIPSSNLSVVAIVAVPITILLSCTLDLLPNNHSTIAYWVLLSLFVLHLFVA